VVAGPAIPRAVRINAVWRTNLMLGVAMWRALADTAPRGKRLLTWALDFRLVPAMEASRFQPSFLFHNVDIQTDGDAEGRMARLASLCVCPSSTVAEIQRRVNPRTIAIGHGITRQISDLTAAAAQRRVPGRPPVGVVGFVGFWDPRRLDLGLVRRMLGAHPDLVFEVTVGPDDVADLSREFPGRVRPLGVLTWPSVLERAVAWDAAVIPYDLRNPNIYHSCPYKLPPLLAAAVPVVCVDIPNIRGLAPHLYMAAGADDFVALVGRAVSGGLPVEPAAVDAFRADRAWDRILDRVIEEYDKASP
jgi:hypothetical protein